MRSVSLLLFVSIQALAADWYPADTTQDGKRVAYVPLNSAAKPWRLCALLPHARDKYWWGVAWGLREEASRLGIKLGIDQAGGYEMLPVQRRQFDACLAAKADAIILAAISADKNNDDIARAATLGVPVIDLVNGVTSARVAARSLVRFADMSGAAMDYVRADAGQAPLTVAWFPGPQGAAWVKDAEAGLARAIRGRNVNMIHAGYGAPESNVQMSLVRAALAGASPDYIVGNAVAIEVSASYLKYTARSGTKIVAFYASEPVIDLLREGRVLAAASDAPVLQARIAVDLAVRILEKRPHAQLVSPVIDVLDAASVRQYDFRRLFPPDSLPFVQMPLPAR
jgi:periplasmic protein TorT